jgi:radical SAM superfamily enzyme YgiQ (UPF0313 family)
MKLTLVLIEIRSGLPGFSGYYSEGLASIAATAKRSGHEVELIHLTRPEQPDQVARRLAAGNPDLIGFSCMTHTFPYLAPYASALRSIAPGIPVMVGGVHAILQPDQCIEVEGVDAVCLGEGEEVVVHALDRLQRGESIADLPGLWVKEDGGEVRRNRPAPLIEELDGLPMPDRSIFDFPDLLSTREGVLYIFASRGCPYSCRFCCNAALRARYPNGEKYLRYKNAPRLCNEIAVAIDMFPGKLRGIYFQDEILGLNKGWLAGFLEEYRARFDIPFNCNLRADLVTPELAGQLHAAGCRSVSLGIESGSETMRAVLLGKRISDNEILDAFEILDRAGLRINTFSMVGLPGESCEDVMETVRLNADPRVNRAMVSIFFPYAGTELHERCVADGILSERMPDTYQETTPLEQSTISRSQVEFLHDHFGLLVSLARRGYGDLLLSKAIVPMLRTDGTLLRLFTAANRRLRRVLVPLYVRLAGHLGSRQSRVFGD